MIGYVKVYYIYHLTRRRVKTPQMTATEHLNITKQMHIDGSSSVCSVKCTNVTYISASVNIVKISILIVSGQMHSSWNSLDVLMPVFKLYNRFSACGKDLNESFKLIRKPIHCSANWFDQAFEQNRLKRMNHPQMGIAHSSEKSKLRVWNKCKHFLTCIALR